MASYNVDIRLGVTNARQVERQLEKIKKNQAVIEDKVGSILEVEKRIVATRRDLLTLEGKARTAAQQRIRVLQVQKQELGLQKKELDQIVRLEKQRAREAAKAARANKSGRNLGRAAAAGVGIGALSIPGFGAISGGALAGGATGGGRAGALVGGAAAAATEAVRVLGAFAIESTKVTAALNLQRRALANTVATQDEYNDALEAVQGISEDFLIPIDQATAGFTKLNAAARSSGFEVSEVEEVYRGLAAANTALGGNSERLAGILLATQQVFSKGKVQAEELRGQIGERLAGAFAEFAESADLSTKDLDKALERGEVSLEDFVNFAKSLLTKYEGNSRIIANAPENAGERLKQSMTKLKTALGPILTDVGESFQTMAKSIVDAFSDAINAFNRFINNAQINQLKSFIVRNQQIIDQLKNKPDRSTYENIRLANAQARLARNKEELQKLLNPIEATGKPPGTSPVTSNNDPKTDPEAERAAERIARFEEQLRRLEGANVTQKELNQLLEDQARAELAGNKAQVVKIEGIKKELEIRSRLFNQIEDIADIEDQSLIRAKVTALEDKAMLDIDKVRINTAKQLAKIQQDQAEAINQQRQGLVGLVRDQGGAFQQLKDQLRQLKLEAQFGENAEIFNMVRNAMTDGSNASFNEAFDLAMRVKEQRELNAATSEYKQLMSQVGNIIQSTVVDSIQRAIDGSLQLRDVLANVLGQLGSLLINAGFNSLGKQGGFLGTLFGGGRAGGGPVQGGSAYVVGESGSELFIPNVSGRVIPADDFDAARAAMSGGLSSSAGAADDTTLFGGGDSMYSSSTANNAFADNRSSINNTRSVYQSSAEQTSYQEAVSAVMGSSGSTVIQTEVINNVEYVTVDQMQKSNEVTAQRARAEVFAEMQNSVGLRKRIGI